MTQIPGSCSTASLQNSISEDTAVLALSVAPKDTHAERAGWDRGGLLQPNVLAATYDKYG